MPAWFWWFICGALVAWLIEWVIDWQFWRARLRKTLAVQDSSSALRERMLADPTFSRRGSQPVAARAMPPGDDAASLQAALAAAQQGAQQHAAAAAAAISALAAARADIAQLRAEPEPPAMPDERAQLQARVAELEQQLASTPAARDPLTAISGIGAAFEKRLYDAGIHTYAQLAQQNPQQLRKIVRANQRQPLKPEAWIAAARELAQQHAAERGAS